MAKTERKRYMDLFTENERKVRNDGVGEGIMYGIILGWGMTMLTIMVTIAALVSYLHLLI